MQTNSFSESLDAICQQDPRYDRAAYVFLRDALEDTIKRRRKSRKETPSDVGAAELLDGFRVYALKEYGPMAATVLEYWGVRSTTDVGNLVFNLVDAQVFSKTDRDTPEAFADAYDFDAAFQAPFRPSGKRLSKFPERDVKRA
ncbi:MAG: Minf_1886 family protein [Chthoniobacterales bacterium]